MAPLKVSKSSHRASKGNPAGLFSQGPQRLPCRPQVQSVPSLGLHMMPFRSHFGWSSASHCIAQLWLGRWRKQRRAPSPRAPRRPSRCPQPVLLLPLRRSGGRRSSEMPRESACHRRTTKTTRRRARRSRSWRSLATCALAMSAGGLRRTTKGSTGKCVFATAPGPINTLIHIHV